MRPAARTLRAITDQDLQTSMYWVSSLWALRRRQLRKELSSITKDVACWSLNPASTTRRCALLGSALCLPYDDYRREAVLGKLVGVAHCAEMALWGFEASAAGLDRNASAAFVALRTGPFKVPLDGCNNERSLTALDAHGWVLTEPHAFETAAGLASCFAGRFDELIEVSALMHR